MKRHLFLLLAFLAPFIGYCQTAKDCFNKGVEKFRLEEYSGAIEYFSKAVQDSSKYKEAYSYKGLARLSIKEYNGAIEDCSKAIEIDPEFAEAYHTRGRAKYLLENSRGAIKDYNKAIEIDPDFVDAYSNRGIAKVSKNDIEGALEDANKAIEINPYYADGYLTRMIVRVKKNDMQGASKDAEIQDKLSKNSSYYQAEYVKYENEKIKSEDKNLFIEAKILNSPYYLNEFITNHPNSVYLEESKQLFQKSKDEYKEKVETNFPKLKKGMTLDEVKEIIPFDYVYRQGSYSNTSTKGETTTTFKTENYSPNDYCNLTFVNDKLESWSKY